MKKSKASWLKIGIVAVVIGLILIFVSRLMGAGYGIYIDSSMKIHIIDGEEKYTYDSQGMDDVTGIDVNVENYSIEVKPSTDKQVYVHVEGDNENDLDIQIIDGVLTITEKVQLGKLTIDLRFMNGSNNELVIYIPEGMKFDKYSFVKSGEDISDQFSYEIK